MPIYYQDDRVTLYHGDSIEQMREMPAESVNCIVTSPPYFGLRDYGNDGQYGLEPTPEEYVETMRAVFAEARRVLADDGTLWLNLGDSYASTSKGSGGPSAKQTSNSGSRYAPVRLQPGVPDKNLLGIPWRVAFALQDDGWILRNDIIWHKPNAMPESVTDRMAKRHEHVFMFAKSQRYWFNIDRIREPHKHPNIAHVDRSRPQRGFPGQADVARAGLHEAGRNPGDVWSIVTSSFPGAHFATMPPKLAERCIFAGCRRGGVVLDPFSGSGTTGMVARKLGRKYVGIDLSSEYLDLSLQTRLGW